MKKISLVQPNFQQGPKEYNAFYLPYSIGILWSYVTQFDTIKFNYQLDKIVWQRTDIHSLAKDLSANDIVAFSTYVWNKNYNYKLAELVKQLNSNVITIFGGPEVPHHKKNIFKTYPFIDIVVKSEGEYVLKDILEGLVLNPDISNIKGLLINSQGTLIDTGSSNRIENLDSVPSPYLTGFFDSVMKENPDIEWNATLETNRGCPYACTFCDWGSLTYNKVKQFNLARVFAELEWIANNRCGFVTITDANFGIFVERDGIIADKLLEIQEKYGYPKSFSITWAKNQKPDVFDIVFKLIKSPKFNQGLTVSVQSMDETVLTNIKRHNLEQHKIDNIFNLCDKHNVPVYTEVILGLPGETKETWKKGIFDIISAGNHNGINFLQAQLLENAEMNLLQKQLFRIKSVPVYDYMSGSYSADNIEESVDVVVSTKNINQSDMIECLIFNWFIQTFHINGLTSYISRVYNKKFNISYDEFYSNLFNFLNKDPWFRQEQAEIINYYKNWMTIGKINHPKINNLEIHGWNLVHRTTINIHSQNKYDYVFSLIKDFIDQFYNIENELNNNLIIFQDNYITRATKLASYPKTIILTTDILGYLQNNRDLYSICKYSIELNHEHNLSLTQFLENLYFSRKRNFGKTLISKL